jgi:phage RecT family recombinase
MTTELTKPESAASLYRRDVSAMSTAMLADLVGEDRLKQATGRMALAFRQAAIASPNLYLATRDSVAQAIAMSALTGLMPGGPMPDVYLLPQKEKGADVLQWFLSWRGMKRLIERAGARIRPVAVFAGEPFTYSEGLSPVLEHEVKLDVDRTFAALIAVYVVVTHPDGHKDFCVLGRKEILARKAKSRSGDNGPWGAWGVEMALKTGLRYAIARGIAPFDDVAATAFGADGTADARQDEPVVVRIAPSASLDVLDAALTSDREPGEEG